MIDPLEDICSEMSTFEGGLESGELTMRDLYGALREWEFRLRSLGRDLDAEFQNPPAPKEPTLVQQIEDRARLEQSEEAFARARLDSNRRLKVQASACRLKAAGLGGVRECYRTSRWDAIGKYRGYEFTVGVFHNGCVAFLPPRIYESERGWESLRPDLTDLESKIEPWLLKCAKREVCK